MLMTRWTAAALFAMLAVAVDVANVVGPIAARRAGKGHSIIPFLGALSGAAACLVCPWSGSTSLIPVAILADVSVAGCIYWLGKAVVDRVRGSRRT